MNNPETREEYVKALKDAKAIIFDILQYIRMLDGAYGDLHFMKRWKGSVTKTNAENFIDYEKEINKIDSFEGKYSFLSNFYSCSINYRGEVFPSVEHAFQAAKTNDILKIKEIKNASSPGRAKRLGRKVDIRQDWESVKIRIMAKLVLQKFTDPVLAKKLIATGDADLIEGNIWYDTFWGVCDGEGQNHLGRILVAVRTNIKG